MFAGTEPSPGNNQEKKILPPKSPKSLLRGVENCNLSGSPQCLLVPGHSQELQKGLRSHMSTYVKQGMQSLQSGMKTEIKVELAWLQT